MPSPKDSITFQQHCQLRTECSHEPMGDFHHQTIKPWQHHSSILSVYPSCDFQVLTLASNERIPLNPTMRLLFEISHLRTATPATVSRAGMTNPFNQGTRGRQVLMGSHLLWQMLKEALERSYEPGPSKLWPSSQPLNHAPKGKQAPWGPGHMTLFLPKCCVVGREIAPDLGADCLPLHGDVLN